MAAHDVDNLARHVPARASSSLILTRACLAQLALQMSVADEIAWLRFMAQIWREAAVIDRMPVKPLDGRKR